MRPLDENDLHRSLHAFLLRKLKFGPADIQTLEPALFQKVSSKPKSKIVGELLSRSRRRRLGTWSDRLQITWRGLSVRDEAPYPGFPRVQLQGPGDSLILAEAMLPWNKEEH